MAYVGRFAPSPTGLLHMGSLVAALASWLDARANQGTWLVRMEDLDPPREEPGAATAILSSLSNHGLHWDGDVVLQSQRHPHYQQAVDTLLAQQAAFYCDCSRKSLLATQGIHTQPCQPASPQHAAVRVKVPDQQWGFVDPIQGEFQQQLQQDVGDFVIQRKDGLFAYQLAVVVDDCAQGVTHIVRGSDLLDSTPRQRFLQQLLSAPTPNYLHIPILVNGDGQKLSKQNIAPAIEAADALDNVKRALTYLHQALPNRVDSLPALLDHAVAHWQPSRLPHQYSQPI